MQDARLSRSEFPAPPERNLAAAGAIFGYAALIGATDNLVRLVAAGVGVWQFHALRGLVALMLLFCLARLGGRSLRPRRAGAVALRSLLVGGGILIYFICLAAMPVAVASAGLFTAPIFILIVGRLAFGTPVTAAQALAAALGFAGTLLVLGPGAVAGFAGPLAALPVLAGFLYGMGNMVTRRWCGAESTEALTAAFFLTMTLFGAFGCIVLWLHPVPVPEGVAGFVLRGPVRPEAVHLGWILFHALAAVLGIWLCVRGYQFAAPARAAIFEYALLPAAAFWGWALWGEVLAPRAALGILLIALAGVAILRGARG